MIQVAIIIYFGRCTVIELIWLIYGSLMLFRNNKLRQSPVAAVTYSAVQIHTPCTGRFWYKPRVEFNHCPLSLSLSLYRIHVDNLCFPFLLFLKDFFPARANQLVI